MFELTSMHGSHAGSSARLRRTSAGASKAILAGAQSPKPQQKGSDASTHANTDTKTLSSGESGRAGASDDARPGGAGDHHAIALSPTKQPGGLASAAGSATNMKSVGSFSDVLAQLVHAREAESRSSRPPSRPQTPSSHHHRSASGGSGGAAAATPLGRRGRADAPAANAAAAPSPLSHPGAPSHAKEGHSSNGSADARPSAAGDAAGTTPQRKRIKSKSSLSCARSFGELAPAHSSAVDLLASSPLGSPRHSTAGKQAHHALAGCAALPRPHSSASFVSVEDAEGLAVLSAEQCQQRAVPVGGERSVESMLSEQLGEESTEEQLEGSARAIPDDLLAQCAAESRCFAQCSCPVGKSVLPGLGVAR